MEGVANPKRRAEEFVVGAKAWLNTSHLPIPSGARKLAAKWTGPYPVVERVTREAYRLQLPPAWWIHDVFHTSQLKAVSGQPKTEAPIVLESG